LSVKHQYFEPACPTLPIHLKSIDLLLAPALSWVKTTTMFWIKQCSRIFKFILHPFTIRDILWSVTFHRTHSFFLCYKS
jgi:hypothetical protein